MAIRFSDAATALMAGDCGLRKALKNATVTFFTGTQPSYANTGYGSAQPIISFTKDDGVYIAEAPARWAVTLSNTTITTDNISSIKIGGAGGTNGMELLSGTVAATASDDTTMAAAVAANINANVANADFTAISAGAVLTIIAPRGSAKAFDTAKCKFTTSGITITTDDAVPTTLGVIPAYGLTFDIPAANADGLSFDLVKPTTETWKGKNGFGPSTAVATAVFTGITTGTTYTAGWGRITCDATDDGSTDTSGTTGFTRVDFSVGTSGTDFVMTPAATFTVNTTSGSEIETTLNSFRLRVKKNMA